MSEFKIILSGLFHLKYYFVFLCFLTFCPCQALAAPKDIFELSMEELMDIEVTSVAKKKPESFKQCYGHPCHHQRGYKTVWGDQYSGRPAHGTRDYRGKD